MTIFVYKFGEVLQYSPAKSCDQIILVAEANENKYLLIGRCEILLKLLS